MDNNFLTYYFSENKKDWIGASILLGEMASKGNEDFLKEITEGINDNNNFYRRRRAHLALVSLYSYSNNHFKINDKEIKDYIYDTIKGKNDLNDNQLIVSTMIFGIPLLIESGKMSLDDFIDLFLNNDIIKTSGGNNLILNNILEIFPKIIKINQISVDVITKLYNAINNLVINNIESFTDYYSFVNYYYLFLISYTGILKEAPNIQDNSVKSNIIEIINKIQNNSFENKFNKLFILYYLLFKFKKFDLLNDIDIL